MRAESLTHLENLLLQFLPNLKKEKEKKNQQILIKS